MWQITTWRDASIRTSRLSCAVRIALANLILITSAALADDTKICLDSKAAANVVNEYKIRCQENIAELSRFLRVNDVKISETGESAYNSKRVACDFSTDPLFKSMRLAASIDKTNAGIVRAGGVVNYIRSTEESVEKAVKKYRITEIKVMATTSKIIKKDELWTLVVFSHASSRAEAVISILENCISPN